MQVRPVPHSASPTQPRARAVVVPPVPPPPVLPTPPPPTLPVAPKPALPSTLTPPLPELPPPLSSLLQAKEVPPNDAASRPKPNHGKTLFMIPKPPTKPSSAAGHLARPADLTKPYFQKAIAQLSCCAQQDPSVDRREAAAQVSHYLHLRGPPIRKYLESL